MFWNSRMMLLAAIAFTVSNALAQDDHIQPYSKNPFYWQYNGKPVLLLGGSDDDNLFQWTGSKLIDQLDLLVSVGGNYLRNTMSDRDSGNVYAFKQLPNDKYDLNQWNEEYWRRWDNFLRETQQRNIIVQIELWDRFDHSREPWLASPWNPKNNVTYTTEESSLEHAYPNHPGKDEQPFFHTIPDMPQYEPELEIIRQYQEKYVEKLLSYALQYGNVLYCMNNETSTPVAWGKYWMNFINAKAHEKGVEVYVTDMFGNFYKPITCELCMRAIALPEVYEFLDISQINSRNFDQAHWDTLQYIMKHVKEYPRPVNHTKVYGSGNTSFGSGSPQDGVERFCRNIIGGSASARFHRPTSGNGLNELSQATIQAFRKLETLIRLWEVKPCMNLLGKRATDEAYLAASPEEKYVLYFTKGGSVSLDLSEVPGSFRLKWINVATGEWGAETSVSGGKKITVTAPDENGWLAALVKQ